MLTVTFEATQKSVSVVKKQGQKKNSKDENTKVLLRKRKKHTARATQPSWFCAVGGGTAVLVRGYSNPRWICLSPARLGGTLVVTGDIPVLVGDTPVLRWGTPTYHPPIPGRTKERTFDRTIDTTGILHHQAGPRTGLRYSVSFRQKGPGTKDHAPPPPPPPWRDTRLRTRAVTSISMSLMGILKMCMTPDLMNSQ